MATPGAIHMMNHHRIYGTTESETDSERRGTLYYSPYIPPSQDKLELYEGPLPKSIKIQVRPGKRIWERLFCCRNSAIDGMNEWMESIFKLKPGPNPIVPENARTISIAMDGFRHGKACHNFEPIHRWLHGSYFNYQIIGDYNIQVTYYIENGVSYVAGFCIYINWPWLAGYEYSSRVVEELLSSRKFVKRTTSSLWIPSTSPPSYDSISNSKDKA